MSNGKANIIRCTVDLLAFHKRIMSLTKILHIEFGCLLETQRIRIVATFSLISCSYIFKIILIRFEKTKEQYFCNGQKYCNTNYFVG